MQNFSQFLQNSQFGNYKATFLKVFEFFVETQQMDISAVLIIF